MDVDMGKFGDVSLGRGWIGGWIEGKRWRIYMDICEKRWEVEGRGGKGREEMGRNGII